ncbi:hypothetical protein HPP92_018994 [Vanilla planifolia]|uniref:C2H2-type domain-containing protein n=1 Tax=Vanilla planifolia TaxID=51239 RepID=A0A835QD43_VANPL|nr:hypothetical protein HPP92_018994 [Vanilla planifolia]
MGNSRHEFTCKTCGRWFATYQALGGHRTGHTRPKEERIPEEKARVHECAVCGAGFPMGQALGGHMRRHRSPAESTSTTRGPVLGRLVEGEDGMMVLMEMDLESTPARGGCEDERPPDLTLFLGFAPVI